MFGVSQIRWKKTAVVRILISTEVYATAVYDQIMSIQTANIV